MEEDLPSLLLAGEGVKVVSGTEGPIMSVPVIVSLHLPSSRDGFGVHCCDGLVIMFFLNKSGHPSRV